MLTCPVVGVAVDDWTTDDLREHARKARRARWHGPWVTS